MKKTMGMGAAAVLLCASAGSADTLEFFLSTEFSGAQTPAGAGPYLKAVFDDGGGAGSVTLTLTSLLIGAAEKVSNWAFNLDPALDSSALGVAYSSGVAAALTSTGNNHYKADGDGEYDIRFDFAGDLGPAGSGSSSVYVLTLAGITASSFDFLSNPAGGHGPFPTAAHVQGIGPGGGGSGWITVPIPQTAYLGFAGLALAAGVGVIKRRR